MTALVSMCAFGPDEDDIYYKGCLRNADMYAEWQPDWTCRFYLGKSAPEWLLSELKSRNNVEIVRMHAREDQTATAWRFLAMRDGGYDFYLSRDVDSRPMPREKAAVEEWIESDYNFHIMRDHPRHGVEMLAGLWGCSAKGALRIAGKIPDRLYGDYYQVDQVFLQQYVWRYAKSSLLAHVGCRFAYYAGETRKFSVPRAIDDYYVGESRRGDDKLRFPEHRAEVMIDPWVLKHEVGLL